MAWKCPRCSQLLPDNGENDQLRAAIKPLAAIKLWSDEYPDCQHDHVVDSKLGGYFSVDDVKAARAANKGGE